MPLKKSASKKAFSENVSAEMHAGKRQPQSLAIAYSVKRKAGKKKMADGGPVEKEKTIGEQIGNPFGPPPKKLAEGGEIVADSNELDEKESSMLDDSDLEAILEGRRAKKMAEGGMVDLEDNSKEDRNNEDQMSFEAAEKELYDLSQLDEQPEDSNLHDDDDIAESVRKSMRMKARLK